MTDADLVWRIETGDIKDVNKELENGRRPIHIAADFGQLQMLEILIAKGADVNVKDRYGITPLLAAVYEGHKDCVALLLRYKAANTEAPDGRKLYECTESEDIKRLLRQ